MHPTPPLLDALRGHYQLHFVDRPRATRSLALLGKLRQQLEALVEQAPADAQTTSLRAAWAEEADAIAHAQQRAGDGGRLLVEALELATRVRWRAARLQRLHPQPLAARPRALQSLAEDAQAALQALDEAQRHAAVATGDQGADAVATAADLAAAATVQSQLTHLVGHLQAQRAQALAARNAPDLAARRQASVLAARAVLLDLNNAVVGLSPVVVRPDYLDQLVHDLREASAAFAEPAPAPAMEGAPITAAAAPHGPDADAHQANVVALQDQVAFWQRQRKHVAAQRRQHTADELAHAVGEAADAVMEAADGVEGPNAATALGYLCLRMDELHRQLVGVPLVFGHDAHRETLAGLADCLAWLEGRRAAVNAPAGEGATAPGSADAGETRPAAPTAARA